MKTALCVLPMVVMAGGPLAADGIPSHFRYDVAPYLAKAGCAAAECHGGATGRGGFKLSLFATNARADYEAITQDLGGRRVNYAEPAASLLLRKPTRQVKHKGGRVIELDSAAYRALESWIRGGAPYAVGEEIELQDLAMELHGDGSARRVRVTGIFEGGNGSPYERDVTGLARFQSTDERVVRIDEDGYVRKVGPGEASLIAQFDHAAARITLVEPFPHESAAPGSPLVERFDPWLGKLEELGLQPAPEADRYRVVRRLYFDLVGRPPSPKEIDDHFSHPPGARLAATARRLLESDGFRDQWARHLMHWLEVPAAQDDLRHTTDRNARLRAEISNFLETDESMLAFATSLFGSNLRAEFLRRFEDPRDRAEFVGRALLGRSIGCARCHNHPSDRWSQAQHLRFSALFADPRPAGTGDRGAMMPGKFFLPGDGKAIEPAFLPLGADEVRVDPEQGHGQQLATFLGDDGAPFFARNVANRVVGLLLGRHLVDAPDDHRLTNPALHEPWLAELAERFSSDDYRLRPLILRIVTSPAYRVDSTPPDGRQGGGDAARQYLARREARPLAADEFLRAAAFVVGVDPGLVRSADTPLSQQLQILNSGLLQEWLRTPGNQVDAIFAFETDPVRQLEDLYLLVLTRLPGDEERAEFLPLLRQASDPAQLGRDLAFALLASREFSSIR